MRGYATLCVALVDISGIDDHHNFLFITVLNNYSQVQYTSSYVQETLQYVVYYTQINMVFTNRTSDDITNHDYFLQGNIAEVQHLRPRLMEKSFISIFW